jgi:hypothetical protein
MTERKYPVAQPIFEGVREHEAWVIGTANPLRRSATAYEIRDAGKPGAGPLKCHASDGNDSTEHRAILWGIIGVLECAARLSSVRIFLRQDYAATILNDVAAHRANRWRKSKGGGLANRDLWWIIDDTLIERGITVYARHCQTGESDREHEERFNRLLRIAKANLEPDRETDY